MERVNNKQYRADPEDGSVIRANVCFNDDCKNGHNTLSVTGDIYDSAYPIRGEPKLKNAKGAWRWLSSGGCCHEVISAAFPGLREAIRFHLVSTDSPLHYIANSMYWAGKRGWTDGQRNSPPNLDHFRSTAVWPEATQADMETVTEEILTARLSGVMAEFRKCVEDLGFTWTTETIR